MVQIRAAGDSARIRARKRAVLRAASEAFRDKGFHDTSMRDIAAALGMTAGNLYYYFENKQALLAFCQDDTLSRLLGLSREVRALDLPADQKLFLIVAGHVVALNQAVPGSLAHLIVENLPEPDRSRCIARRDAYERELRELVARGIGEGAFRPVDAKLAVLTLLGALNWTVRWFRPGGAEAPERLGRRMADLLVRGLLADGRELVAPAIEIPVLADPEDA